MMMELVNGDDDDDDDDKPTLRYSKVLTVLSYLKAKNKSTSKCVRVEHKSKRRKKS